MEVAMTRQNMAAVRAASALTPIETARFRRQLWGLVCSSPWLDRCWGYLVDAPRAGKRVDHMLSRAAIYPPGGAGPGRTRIKRCMGCGVRWYPPQYVRGCGLCEECVAAMQVPNEPPSGNGDGALSSPTGEAMRQLERLQVRLVERRLPAEDDASLRRQIAEYLARHPQDVFMRSKNTKKHD
jgi:hypothetical protein